MSGPDDLLKSIAELRNLIESRPVIGVSAIAEKAQLAVLVRKYPGEARRLVAELDGSGGRHQ